MVTVIFSLFACIQIITDDICASIEIHEGKIELCVSTFEINMIRDWTKLTLLLMRTYSQYWSNYKKKFLGIENFMPYKAQAGMPFQRVRSSEVRLNVLMIANQTRPSYGQ